MKNNLPGIHYMKCIFHLMKGFTCKIKILITIFFRAKCKFYNFVINNQPSLNRKLTQKIVLLNTQAQPITH